ncbi:levanase (2,6-beta-D-fructanfructanohydrolase) [gut metagenome]|uniref:Levanase (2,6-beta-D-fructanfructanohydrolase) n=1 Tax=gut metagenome TaxID=749906 RepID=J9FPL6_9ZZZZ
MNNVKKLIAMTVVGFSIGMMQAQNCDGLKIHYLGANHSLIRVEQPQKYLLLPVEESAPETTIHVLVNNEVEKSFQVRLAVNKVDYTVPFDLTPYQGKAVVMDVHNGNNHSDVSDVMNDACWSKLELTNTFDTTNREKFRPLYHHTPTYGWMNDPNGMFYKDGEYHLFYQYNPYGSMWGNMNWGHSSSKDLINWEHHPLAIEPNGLGTVFSGSSVVDKENVAGFGKDAIIAIYTSAGASQMQSLAYSTDNGRTFQTYKHNPILTADREARDPNMFYHKESGKWILILAAALDKEMWIYSSDDLKNWTKESTFGKGYGAQEGVWECPDLMKLPVRGTNESKWVLICNINPGGPFGGSASQYFVGDFDGKKFTCSTQPEVTKWLDYGKDHYAAVSWSNTPENRHTLIAWMSNWQYANQVPTLQYRSANSLPRELELFRGKDGDYYVSVTPAPEVEALRGAKPIKHDSFPAGNKKVSHPLPTANQGICEIDLQLHARDAKKIYLTLSNAQGEETVLLYDIQAATFSMDRTRSGLTTFNPDFPAVTVAPHADGNQQHLRLFIDRCSLEAFDGEGRFAMTNLVFPEHPYTSISISTDKGRCKVDHLTIYPIQIK